MNKINDAEAIVAAVKPLLAGHAPEIQGAAIGELVAVFLAGHHPDLREQVLAMHVDLVRDLIPLAEHDMAEAGMRPDDWPPIAPIA